jgi:glycerol-3-phosphate dehydrogenase
MVKSKAALWLALKINDLVSFDRNSGLSKESKIPNGKTISKNELAKIAPGIVNEKTSGGALWYESIAKNTERLLFEFLHYSTIKDAEIANYVKAINFNFKGNEIESVRVQDEIRKEQFNIKARVIVNSVGPWLNQILSETKDYKILKTPLTKAVNIIVKGNLFDKYAVGIESIKEFKDKSAIVNKGKRLFFFVPLEKYTMIGTTYKIFENYPDECKINEQDITEILNEINTAYKDLNLTLDDVTQTHVGAQAMPDDNFENEFDVQPETHSLLFDHHRNGSINNLLSIKSVKYTTAPSIAKEIARTVLKKLNRASINTVDEDSFNNDRLNIEDLFP